MFAMQLVKSKDAEPVDTEGWLQFATFANHISAEFLEHFPELQSLADSLGISYRIG